MKLSSSSDVPQMKYVLVTAAWNEEKCIEIPLRSVTAQSHPPLCWIIVDDGSTDKTAEIVQDYSNRYSYIRLYRMPNCHERSFAAQVDAINAGYEQLKSLDFDFVGNLDADISVDPGYFAKLIEEFCSQPELGLAGGALYERKSGEFEERTLNAPHSVPHGIQFFRRECFDLLGGYRPLPHGSPDWYAEVSLRMNGWGVRSIPTLRAYHHRPTGTARGRLWYSYRQGRADYSLGTHPLFELAKVARRVPSGYFGMLAAAELTGFVYASCKREERVVSGDFVRFLRNEQIGRLKSLLISGRK